MDLANAVFARTASASIRCRVIGENDIAGVVDLLAVGFPARAHGFWAGAMQRLSHRATPPGCPRYGYLLESDGAAVGVILTIFSEMVAGGKTTVRCNLSSWYVIPPFRCYATLLTRHALARRDATYVNVTPSLHTVPVLEAQGHTRYCSGRFLAAPALGALSSGARVEAMTPEVEPADDLSSFEVRLLADHATYGCISVICRSKARRHPFVFSTGRTTRAPAAYLAYCRDVAEFVRFAGPLGRFLAWRGFPLVMLDANGPVPGLVGKYVGGQDPKYFKGTAPPRLGDLAYTERAIFGV